MEFKQILVTPAIAKNYLEANTNNRKIKIPVVLRYADDIASGRWKQDTGELIKISSDGAVLDGQHRLLAVVKSGVPTLFGFVFGLSPTVFDVLDTGSIRSSSDVFHIKNIKNSSLMSAVLNFYLTIKSGSKTDDIQKNNRPTNAVILKEYESNPSFYDRVALKTLQYYNAFAKILSTSIVGGLYLVFSQINETDAENFFSQLTTGSDITNNTILVLRQKMIQERLAVRKLPINIKVALIIKAWNSFRNKEELKIIKFDSTREKYPVAI